MKVKQQMKDNLVGVILFSLMAIEVIAIAIIYYNPPAWYSENHRPGNTYWNGESDVSFDLTGNNITIKYSGNDVRIVRDSK